MLLLSLFVLVDNTALAASKTSSESSAKTSRSTSASTCDSPEPIRGDTNEDCVVDTADSLDINGMVGTTNPLGDLDEDGDVDSVDIAIWEAVSGTTCATRLLGDVNGDGVVDGDDNSAYDGYISTQDRRGDVDRDGDVDAVDDALITANTGATMGARVLGDITGDDLVDSEDQLAVANAWGAASGCAADVNLDGTVDWTDWQIVGLRMDETSGTQPLAGDLNGDDIVDDIDYDLLLAAWNTSWVIADLTGDGTVNTSDLLILLRSYGTVAGQVLPGDVDGNWVVDGTDTALVTASFGTPWAQADMDASGTVSTPDHLDSLLWFSTFADIGGDVDGDCEVTSTDYALFNFAFGTDWLQADINGDGVVGLADIDLWDWDATCQ